MVITLLPFMCTIIVFVIFFYFTVKLEGTALRSGAPAWMTSVFVLVTRLSLFWRVHVAQWTQYRQINLSIYPLSAAFSKCPRDKFMAGFKPIWPISSNWARDRVTVWNLFCIPSIPGYNVKRALFCFDPGGSCSFKHKVCTVRNNIGIAA